MRDALTLLTDTDALFRDSKYAEAEPLYRRAADLAAVGGDRTTQTEALAQVARCFAIQGRQDEGRPWLAQAAALADPADPIGWSRFLGVRGRFEWHDGDLATARATFEAMYNYCRAHGLPARAIDAAHMVAIVAVSPDDQIAWGRKGVAEAEAGGITHWLGPLWNNLGATYEHLKDYANALDAYHQASVFHHEHGTDRQQRIAEWAVGHAHRLVGDTDVAARWLEPVLLEFEAAGDTEFTGLTHRELGELALARGDRAAAREHFTRALSLLKDAGMPDWDAAGYAELEARLQQLNDERA